MHEETEDDKQVLAEEVSVWCYTQPWQLMGGQFGKYYLNITLALVKRLRPSDLDIWPEGDVRVESWVSEIATSNIK